MISCPCCSRLLLPHIRSDAQIHWFCRHCWQDMPVFSLTTVSLTEIMVEKISRNFYNKERLNKADSIYQRQTIDGRVELQDVLV
ncbi:hypothetical protein [Nostoc sp. MS1]|uniref:hypothetical protein n=1 Tax=Nostoc sp. MS1 TaxID=2764711 RepID=UPI001CC5B0A3|nr:hypothetical protein [Nostoc sp. MS1]